MSVAATLSTSLVESTPGGETTVRVRVLNDGDVVDELDLRVVGEPRGWTRVVPERLFLMPGGTGVADVVFAPPRDASVPAGVRRFGVRVRSREDPDAAVVEEGSAIVAPFADLAIAVRPGLRRGRWGAAYDVALTNRGNAPAVPALDVTDAEAVLRHALPAGPVAVGPGETATVRLRVRPRRPLPLGQPRVHLVTVTAACGTEAVTGTVTYLQRPLVPAWLVRVAVALAVVVLVLAVGAYALLGPLPQPATSARHSTTTEQGVARAAQAAARAQQQAADAAAAQVALAEEQRAAPPPPGPLTTPYGTSLVVEAAVGATGGADLPRDPASWPPDSGLALTDLVLMNRAGDTVEVRVLRSGTPLFVLHADTPDARALTFGAPVVLAAADTLTVELTCIASEEPGCRPTVYAGGFLTGKGKS